MKVEIELPKSLVAFYDAYAAAFRETRDEAMEQVLSDFCFGAVELGFRGGEPLKED